MRWLRDQLEQWSRSNTGKTSSHYRTRAVWFEPWKYHTRDDVWRGLIAEVILHSIDVDNATVTTVVSAAKQFGGFLGRSFIRAISGIKLKGKAEAGVVVSKAGFEAEVNLDTLSKIAEDYKQYTHPEKAFLNEFESTLKHWVEENVSANERMVLFIDDLDRCLPSVVLEVLEALKLYLNIPQLVFVIGLDRDVVKAVIRKHYEQAGLPQVKADSYLDKMFQVEVEVSPTESLMDGYFNTQVTRLDALTNNHWTISLKEGGDCCKPIIETAVRKIARHNPREVKRLLNSTLRGGDSARRASKNVGPTSRAFAQGCQAYLIARILRDNILCPASILLRQETWTFLEKWSDFIERYPNYVHRPAVASEDEGGKILKAKPSAPKRSVVEEMEYEAFQTLAQAQPRSLDGRHDVYPLLDVEPLWQLLMLKCSAEVGMAVAARAAEARPSSADDPAAARPSTDAAIRKILAHLPRVVVRDIALYSGVEVADLTAEHVASLTSLELGGYSGDLEVVAISLPDAGLKSLRRLSLDDTLVGDVGVSALASPESGLKSLTQLHLDGTKISDAAVTALASPETGLKSLAYLDLCRTQVGDASVDALAAPTSGLTSLEVVNLPSPPVTEEAMERLRRAKPGLRVTS